MTASPSPPPPSSPQFPCLFEICSSLAATAYLIDYCSGLVAPWCNIDAVNVHILEDGGFKQRSFLSGFLPENGVPLSDFGCIVCDYLILPYPRNGLLFLYYLLDEVVFSQLLLLLEVDSLVRFLKAFVLRVHLVLPWPGDCLSHLFKLREKTFFLFGLEGLESFSLASKVDIFFGAADSQRPDLMRDGVHFLNLHQ